MANDFLTFGLLAKLLKIFSTIFHANDHYSPWLENRLNKLRGQNFYSTYFFQSFTEK